MKYVLIIAFLFNLLFSQNNDFKTEDGKSFFTQEEQVFIANSSKIKIGSINDYEPFNFLHDNKQVGLTQDILNIISKKSGLKFENITGPWSVIFNKFKDGKLDMISEISYTKDRLPFTLYTKPYYEMPIAVFTRGDFGEYNSIKSLRGKKIALLKGSYFSDYLAKFKDIDIVNFNTQEEKFYALRDNKVDIVFSSPTRVHWLQKNMIRNIKIAGYITEAKIKKEDLRFGINKQSKILASIINKSFDSIPFSTITALRQKWIFNQSQYNQIKSLINAEKKWIQNNTITIGIESAKPYIFYNQSKNDIDGLYSDILKLAINNTGLKVKYIQGDWNTLLKNFKEKKLDLLPATFYSKSREDFGFYSDPYYQVREYIYTKNTNTKINSFKDLNGKKIAIVKGYATIEKIQEKFPKINIVQTDSLSQSVSMLLNGEIESLIDYHLVVESYIRENSIVELKAIAQSELEPISVHYLSHIDKPLLHSVLQKGLKSISREEKNALLEQWVRTPYEKQFLSLEEKQFLQKNMFNIYLNNWEPFTSYNKEKNSYNGLSIDIWEYLSMQSNIKYKYLAKEDFSTMLGDIKKDPKGVLISTSYVKDREEYADFTKSYISFPIAVATNLKEEYIIDFKELEGKEVAVGKNYTAYKLLVKNYPNIKFVTVKNTVEALRLVEKNKVFAAVDILPVLISNMSKYNYNNLKISGTSKIKIDLQIMVNKKSKKLVDILNKFIDKIDKNEVQQINNKWLTHTKYIESTNYTLIFKIVIPILIILTFILILYNNLKKSNKIIQQQKEELETSNIRLTIAAKASFDLLYEWDVKNDSLIWYGDIDKFLGYENNEISQNIKSWINLIHPDDRYKLENAVEEHRTSIKPIQDEYRIRQKNGKYQDWIDHALPILDKDNKPIKWIGVCTDQTLAKNNQKQLVEQSKMAAMGEMIGNIAHQWRQPLSVISTGATGLKMQKECNILTDEIFNSTCTSINNNAQYLSKTIDDFKNFIKGNRTKTIFSLKNGIESFLTLVVGSIKNHNIDMVLDLEDDIKIDGYENELIQCLINIFNNAKDILVEKKLENKIIFISISIENNKGVIKIKDNAGGIEENNISKIFEPYFTTKHKSQGTGLGLHMAYNLVVDGMKGSIEAKNTTYEYEDKSYTGAEFIISLPLS